ncbi:EAL domain-containing protein [Magnetospira sp. QH-2]|uniref:EAL domain-containing protein n=1 Tax=Magnetospira sp. (strain QH-2) TaxID=1288970 RepID=UPI0003E8177B|nr:EAL domain-containing protein [Magnetospira sp. QH-2]CCQ72032.1 conserved protein of unknown function [Magnetospira sp. QH-2]
MMGQPRKAPAKASGMDDTVITTFNPTLGTSGDEPRLVDHIRRIRHNREGSVAVHVHLSRLRPYHRESTHIRIASRSFDNLCNNHDASVYVMANCDLVLITRDVKVSDIDTVVLKLRTLFSEDPVIFADEDIGHDRFSSWYDLDNDFQNFWMLLEDLVDEGKQVTEKGRDQTPEALLGKPMNALTLSALTERLQKTRIADLISRQGALHVTAGNGGGMLFQEHFMSIADLKKRVAPGVHIVSDFWLFQYLTETLDKRMLAVLGRRDFSTLKWPVSMNMNISTVRSPEFKVFTDRVGEHTDKVVLELQHVDVFADIQAYFEARDRLRDQGYRVLIDGVNPLSLRYFNPTGLDPDYIKINWSADLRPSAEAGRMDRVRELMHDIRERVILARIDNEDAVRVGLQLGVQRFQGRFIDKLVAAMSGKGGD